MTKVKKAKCYMDYLESEAIKDPSNYQEYLVSCKNSTKRGHMRMLFTSEDFASIRSVALSFSTWKNNRMTPLNINNPQNYV